MTPERLERLEELQSWLAGAAVVAFDVQMVRPWSDDVAELLRERDAAEARVKELEASMLRHFQTEHLEGDGPEIDRWKRRVKELEANLRGVENALVEVGMAPLASNVVAAILRLGVLKTGAETRVKELEDALTQSLHVTSTRNA